MLFKPGLHFFAEEIPSDEDEVSGVNRNAMQQTASSTEGQDDDEEDDEDYWDEEGLEGTPLEEYSTPLDYDNGEDEYQFFTATLLSTCPVSQPVSDLICSSHMPGECVTEGAGELFAASLPSSSFHLFFKCIDLSGSRVQMLGGISPSCHRLVTTRRNSFRRSTVWPSRGEVKGSRDSEVQRTV
ncbi:importin-8-like isoform X2 [Arapaima gigas]